MPTYAVWAADAEMIYLKFIFVITSFNHFKQFVEDRVNFFSNNNSSIFLYDFMTSVCRIVSEKKT